MLKSEFHKCKISLRLIEHHTTQTCVGGYLQLNLALDVAKWTSSLSGLCLCERALLEAGVL